MRNAWRLSVCIALLLAAAAPVCAQGWSISDINPLARLPMPKRPAWTSAPAMRAPAPVRKLGQGTKRFLSKTWNTVTFQSDDSRGRSASPSSWQLGSSMARRREAEQRKSSWFGSLFQSEQPKPIKTANDFLKLARPQP